MSSRTRGGAGSRYAYRNLGCVDEICLPWGCLRRAPMWCCILDAYKLIGSRTARTWAGMEAKLSCCCSSMLFLSGQVPRAGHPHDDEG